jgi:hypothetical protein
MRMTGRRVICRLVREGRVKRTVRTVTDAGRVGRARTARAEHAPSGAIPRHRRPTDGQRPFARSAGAVGEIEVGDDVAVTNGALLGGGVEVAVFVGPMRKRMVSRPARSAAVPRRTRR